MQQSSPDIPEEEAIDLMKKAAKATYGRKGDKIVQMNYDAIDAGAKQIVEIEVPESWKSAADLVPSGAAAASSAVIAIGRITACGQT